jgi:hypothetical protein
MGVRCPTGQEDTCTGERYAATADTSNSVSTTVLSRGARDRAGPGVAVTAA